MPKLVTIQPHLGVEELEQRYRQCSDLVESRHYQIIWLLAKGKTTAEVAEVTGYSREWIRRLARRYNQQGCQAIQVRVIEYTIENPDKPQENLTYRLITSLFDIVQFPAQLLATEYHQRWEVENTIDELKIHLCERKTPIRAPLSP